MITVARVALAAVAASAAGGLVATMSTLFADLARDANTLERMVKLPLYILMATLMFYPVGLLAGLVLGFLPAGVIGGTLVWAGRRHQLAWNVVVWAGVGAAAGIVATEIGSDWGLSPVPMPASIAAISGIVAAIVFRNLFRNWNEIDLENAQ